MICVPCRERRHADCPGGTWCDCQHLPPEHHDADRDTPGRDTGRGTGRDTGRDAGQGTVRDAGQAEESRLSWVRQG